MATRYHVFEKNDTSVMRMLSTEFNNILNRQNFHKHISDR